MYGISSPDGAQPRYRGLCFHLCRWRMKLPLGVSSPLNVPASPRKSETGVKCLGRAKTRRLTGFSSASRTKRYQGLTNAERDALGFHRLPPKMPANYTK